MNKRYMRRIVKKVARKNRRSDKLVRKGKFNRALKLMHEALTLIEDHIGTSNIALAKQHLKLARFRIKEARRAQLETMLQICNAEIDRVKLSQSFAGRLVLRKLSRKKDDHSMVVTCSEMFGLLHIAEATYHGQRAVAVLRQSMHSHPVLYQNALFLVRKLHRFFDIDSEGPYPTGSRMPACPACTKSKGRTNRPAFVPHSITSQINPVAAEPISAGYV